MKNEDQSRRDAHMEQYRIPRSGEVACLSTRTLPTLDGEIYMSFTTHFWGGEKTMADAG